MVEWSSSKLPSAHNSFNFNLAQIIELTCAKVMLGALDMATYGIDLLSKWITQAKAINL